MMLMFVSQGAAPASHQAAAPSRTQWEVCSPARPPPARCHTWAYRFRGNESRRKLTHLSWISL